jgi:5-oxoprolinase (ATP-hydrolysing)
MFCFNLTIDMQVFLHTISALSSMPSNGTTYMPQSRKLALGIDIGGTFTDVVVLDENTRKIHSHKELTTPRAPAEGVLRGVKKLYEREGLAYADTLRVVHATTLFTNALIERRGARTAFLTTRGFRDIVALGRERKYDIYDLQLEMPSPLCPLDCRFEITERIGSDGEVLQALAEAEVVAAVKEALAKGCESIAVGFLNSHLDSRHEARAAEVIRSEFPHVSLTVSHEAANEIREYERFTTAIANAYIQPLAQAYLQALADGLIDAGLACPLLVMRSNGGLTTVAGGAANPIQLLESGPAAGTLAAAWFARAAGVTDFVALDLGGTTAKLCAVENGVPLVTHLFEAARQKRFVPESGLPIRIPTVDLIEIGAGGGGIARVDKLGLLKVGPESAASEPGPACYGRGGTHATVTDANLTMGLLDPAYFANGEITLSTQLAGEAMRKLADGLSVTPMQAALGIHDVANESMAAAARVHAAERGADPSRLALLVTGGGGPIHGAGVARKLGIKRLLCPAAAGVASAIGLVLAPLRTDLARFVGVRLQPETFPSLQAAFESLRKDAESAIADIGLHGKTTYDCAAELRYAGQGFEIPVNLTAALDSADPVAAIRAGFESQYRAIFGQVLPWGEVEVTMTRLTATVSLVDNSLPLEFPASTGARDADAAPAQRDITLQGTEEAVPAAIYRWRSLREGSRINGPALVEQEGSTLVLAAGDRMTVGAGGTAVVELGYSAAPTGELDNIRLEILWRRLIAIVDEASAALVRTSFSTVVRESDDFSVVLTDAQGNSLAQGTKSIPVFIGSLPRTVRHFIEKFGGQMKEGDVYITNDAWLGTGHLSDINLAAPLFHRGRLVGFAASTAHAADIGGNSNAYHNTDVFQEGLQIPSLKLREAGVMNETVVEFIRANVRAPEQVVGDVFGQLSALNIIDKRVASVLQEWQLDDLSTFARLSFERTDAATRRSIASLKKGTYVAQQYADGMGTPLLLKATVRVEDDSITVDYTGSSPQIKAALNVAYCYTHAFTVYALKCLLDAESPNNEGSFRALHVEAPEGSVLNHQFPYPGGIRATVGHYLPSLVFQALAPALPGRVLASAGSPIWALLLRGKTDDGEAVMVKSFYNGGMGASENRDGLSVTSWPSNISGTPLEVMERLGPVRVNYRKLRTGSGGAGCHTGGHGIDTEIEITRPGDYTLNLVGCRVRNAAPGLMGGQPGATGEVLINGEPADIRRIHSVKLGDRIIVRTPGGGGYGATPSSKLPSSSSKGHQ